MHYKIAWLGLAADKSCTRYRRKYTFTIHKLQSCELSTHESRHVLQNQWVTNRLRRPTDHCAVCVKREGKKRNTGQYV